MNLGFFTSSGVMARSPRGFILALCWMLLFGLCAPVQAKRIALVIGNDAYEHVNKLQKAGNDAKAMARELSAAGFEVQLHLNLNYRSMVRAVEALSKRITGGDEVVVFFAGHGVQIKTGSFMLPTDIEATTESEVEKTAYGVNDLTEKLSEAKAAFALVVVDACRDNPLKAAGRSVGNSRGLSAIEPPKGQMVIYSASRGQQALDRLNDKDPNPNGVFTREFIAKMRKPGLKIEDLVRDVQDSVEALAQTIKHEQRPAIYNEARGNFYFFGPTTVIVGPQAPAKPEAVAPSVRPGQVQGLSLADLEREEATRKEWTDWQGRMKADFDKTAAFAGSADLMAKAWERFLVAWAQDNPMSTQDEALRAQALEKRDVARQASAQAPQVVAQPPVASSAGQTIKDCSDCPEMVVIPAGSFAMGSNEDASERPVHRVNVPSFLIGKTEVTQGQWKAVMGSNPSLFSRCGEDCPVEQVSWNEAQQFAQRLSQKTGKQYRLPSEAEWEYAARAGTSTKWSFGDNESQLGDYAWFRDNSQSETQRVAQKRPNAFGLFDMHGNVWEWTQDCWHDNYTGALTDGRAWTTGCSGSFRVLRGGSWSGNPAILRSAVRGGNTPDDRSGLSGGLRLARTLLTP